MFSVDERLTRRTAIGLSLSAGVAAVLCLPLASRVASADDENPWGTSDPFLRSLQKFVDVVRPPGGMPRIVSEYGSNKAASFSGVSVPR